MKQWGRTLDGKMRKSLSKWNLRLNNWPNFLKQKSSWTLSTVVLWPKWLSRHLGQVTRDCQPTASPVRLTAQVRPGNSWVLSTQRGPWEHHQRSFFLILKKCQIVQAVVPAINLYCQLGTINIFLFFTFQTHLDQSIHRAGFLWSLRSGILPDPVSVTDEWMCLISWAN